MISNSSSSEAGADGLADISAFNEEISRKRANPEPPDNLNRDDTEKYKMLELFKKSLKRAKHDDTDSSDGNGDSVVVTAAVASAPGSNNGRANNLLSKPKSGATRTVRKSPSSSSLSVVVDEVLPERVVCSLVGGQNKAVRYFKTAQEVAECLSVRVSAVITVLRGIRQSFNGLAFRYEKYAVGEDPTPNGIDALSVEQVLAVAAGAKGVRGVAELTPASEPDRPPPNRRPPAPPRNRTPSTGVRSSNPFGCKAVCCIDVESGHVVQQFESIAAASRSLEIGSSQLSACCLGKIDTAYGFRWKYDTGNLISRRAVPVPSPSSNVLRVPVQELNLFDLQGVIISVPVQLRAAGAPVPSVDEGSVYNQPAIKVERSTAGESVPDIEPESGAEPRSRADAAEAEAVNGNAMAIAELRQKIRDYVASGQPIGGYRKGRQSEPQISRLVECISMPNEEDNRSDHAETVTILHRFKSVTEASRLLGVGHSQIIKCCRGQVSSAYGFRWRFREMGPSRDEDGPSDNEETANSCEYVPVPLEDLVAKVVRLKEAHAEEAREAQQQLLSRSVSCLYGENSARCNFNNVGEASSLLGLTVRHISHCCHLNSTSAEKAHALSGLRFYHCESGETGVDTDGVCADGAELGKVRVVLKKHAHKTLFTQVIPGSYSSVPKDTPALTQILCIAHGDPQLTVIHSFPSVSAAERELKIGFKKISACCKGYSDQIYGLRFVYAANVMDNSTPSDESAESVDEVRQNCSSDGKSSPSIVDAANDSGVGSEETPAVPAEVGVHAVAESPIVVDGAKFLPLSEVQGIVRANKASAVGNVNIRSSSDFPRPKQSSNGNVASNGSHPVCCSDASDPSNKIIYRFSSIGCASRELRVSSRRISSCCKGEATDDVFGLKFKYDEPNQPSDGSNLLTIHDLLAIVELHKPAAQVYSSQVHRGKSRRRFVRRGTGETIVVDLNEIASRRKPSANRRVDCYLPEFTAVNITPTAAEENSDADADGNAMALSSVPVNSANTLLKSFPDAFEAAAQLKIPHSAIVDCCIFEELYGQRVVGDTTFCPGSIFFGGFLWRFSPAVSGQKSDLVEDTDTVEEEEYELCTIILCDGCNDEFPLDAVGLKVIPEDNWYCLKCRSAPEEPGVPSSVVSNSMELEIPYQDRDNSQFCALSSEAMMKLKATVWPPEVFQKRWVPGARKSGTVFYKLWCVCEEKRASGQGDVFGDGEISALNPAGLGGSDVRTMRFLSTKDAVNHYAHIPTEVDVVNLCIYGGLDRKGNSWSFEKELLEPELDSSSEEESESEDTQAQEPEIEIDHQGSRHATRLLRPKRVLASAVHSDTYADVKPITLHGSKAPAGDGNSGDNSNSDFSMFACSKSSKYTIAVGDDFQVTAWPKTEDKSRALALADSLEYNCVFSEDSPEYNTFADRNLDDSDIDDVDGFLAYCLRLQLKVGAIVHCFFPAPASSVPCESSADACVTQTPARQYSKLVVIVPPGFLLPPEPPAGSVPEYLEGYAALLNSIYGAPPPVSTPPEIGESTTRTGSRTVSTPGSGDSDVGINENTGAEEKSEDRGMNSFIDHVSKSPADKTGMFSVNDSDVVNVFDGVSVSCVPVSCISPVISEDKVLEEYGRKGSGTMQAGRQVLLTVLRKIHIAQWSYHELCYYIAARNYYSTGAHKLPQFPKTCKYLQNNYTFMDTWDRLVDLSRMSTTGTEMEPGRRFTRSLAECIEFHFNCMNRAGDLIEDQEGSSEVNPFDSEVTKAYLYIFFVADDLKRKLTQMKKEM